MLPFHNYPLTMRRIFTLVLMVFLAISLVSAEDNMQIEVLNNNIRIVYELNDSKAAKELYDSLPITTDVENFSNNEKIFYPEVSLDTSSLPLARGGSGILAYYRPWGNIVMFYGSFSSNSSLFGLGRVVEGEGNISRLRGEITVNTVE